MEISTTEAINFFSIRTRANSYKNNPEASDATSQIINAIERHMNIIYRPDRGLMIDLGCGPGQSFLLFQKAFKFERIHAVDGSQVMIDFVNDLKIENVKITSQLGDIRKNRVAVTIDNSAELVVCCKTTYFLDDIENVFKEASRLLKPLKFFIVDILHHEKTTKVESYYAGLLPIKSFSYPMSYILHIAEKYNLYPFSVLKSDKFDNKEIESKHSAFFFMKM